jgi:hypothetical protein
MKATGYLITSDGSEDTLDRAETLADAIRIARDFARDEQGAEAVCIENGGLVVRQFVRMPDGRIDEIVTG